MSRVATSGGQVLAVQGAMQKGDMLDWLTNHRETLSFGIDVGMLFVWIAYLQVFVWSFRRQRQANILLGLGGGSGLEARCLVSNLSQSAIYIRSLILDLETDEGTSSHPVTELEELEEWKEPSDVNLWTRQGPLDPGAVRDMGTFRAMLVHAIRATGTMDAEAASEAIDGIMGFRLTVIAHYGPEDLLVAAEQTYAIVRRGKAIALRPGSVAPRQIRSRRERRRIRARLEQIVAP